MKSEQLRLSGTDRARYYAPAALFCFLAALSAAFAVTAQFLARSSDAMPLAGAGIFGCLVCGSLGVAVVWIQRRELRFESFETDLGLAESYRRIVAVAEREGWRICRAEPEVALDAQARGTPFGGGEWVAVRFLREQVRIASICDPAVGFSLRGRERCAAHRERLRAALEPAAPGLLSGTSRSRAS